MSSVMDIEKYFSLKLPPTKSDSRSAPPSPNRRAAVRLSANENPYGCSPRVQQALANYSILNIYPEQPELISLLAGYCGVDPKYVLPSHGASEFIDLIAHLFIGTGDESIGCIPHFGLFTNRANLYGGKFVAVPRKEDFSLNVAAVKSAITSKTKMIYIVNPNNPTGTISPQRDILEILDTGLPTIVDEAYAEFAGETVIPFISKYENLIVVRTLSKWAGLAGVRIGFGVASPKIIQSVNKFLLPFHVSRVALVAVQESLKDINYLMSNVKAIVEERERLFALLSKFSFLKPYPSRGNFICCAVIGRNAVDVQQKIEANGIRVVTIDLGEWGKNFLRITIGKPEHTDMLIKALNDISTNEV